MNLALHIASTQTAEQVVVVDATDVVVGRSSTCDIRLPFESVSAQHLRLLRRGPRWTAQDLGSRNGTLLDGVAMHTEPVELEDGATLKIGEVVIRAQLSAARHDAPTLTQSGSLFRALVADAEDLASGAYLSSTKSGVRIKVPDAPADFRPDSLSIRIDREGAGFRVSSRASDITLNGAPIPAIGATLSDGAELDGPSGKWTFHDPLERHVAARDAGEVVDAPAPVRPVRPIGVALIVLSVAGLIFLLV